MIAVNFGARFFAILMIFFVLVVTFYFHDFWNQSPPDNAKTLIDALKNLLDHRRLVHDRGLWPRTALVGTGLRRLGRHHVQARRHGVTVTSSAGSSICDGPARSPCDSRTCCGVRAGTPGKQGSPSGSRTRGACESQNTS